MKKIAVFALALIVLVVSSYYLVKNKQTKSGRTSTNVISNLAPLTNSKIVKDREVILSNLDIPWELAFLQGEELLITERPGKLLKVGKGKHIIDIQGVQHVGEGGLLGLALHPNFSSNHYIYLYLTSGDGGNLTNRVEKYKLDGNSLNDRKVILSGILGSQNHDGGRIAFGPDGYLYVTTGDASQSNLAQNTKSLNGKILRIKDDGSIPSDNPFGNAVYSYGHRNVQGITWDKDGNLWATEHGRSGLQSGLDELNLIEKGKNYGWPIIQGDEKKAGMVTSVINSGPSETWAPSGAVYYNGSIFFAGLRGTTLYEAQLQGKTVKNLKKYFKDEYGRLRTVLIGPDNMLYILTNNTDGRGKPKDGDDKLIRINPQILK